MVKKKIVILGSSGSLGQEIYQVFNNAYFTIKKILIKDCDYIDNPKKLYDTIRKIKPNYLINCAALTKHEVCERKIKLAYELNSFLPYRLSLISKKLNIVFIHFSTEAVFSGEGNSTYDIKKIPLPKTIYGKSKLVGEKLVIDNPQSLVIRLPMIYGKYNNNFMKLINKVKKDKKVYAANDIFSTPINSKDVALFLKDNMEKDNVKKLLKKKIIHLSTNRKLSFFELIYTMSKKIDKEKNIIPVKNIFFDKNDVKPKNLGLKTNINNFKITKIENFIQI